MNEWPLLYDGKLRVNGGNWVSSANHEKPTIV